MKGYAKPLDSGKIVNAISAYLAGLEVNVYWEYVRSKANIADYPSRLRPDLMIRALQRAGLNARVRMVTCSLPDVRDWMTTLPAQGLSLPRTYRLS